MASPPHAMHTECTHTRGAGGIACNFKLVFVESAYMRAWGRTTARRCVRPVATRAILTETPNAHYFHIRRFPHLSLQQCPFIAVESALIIHADNGAGHSIDTDCARGISVQLLNGASNRLPSVIFLEGGKKGHWSNQR